MSHSYMNRNQKSGKQDTISTFIGGTIGIWTASLGTSEFGPIGVSTPSSGASTGKEAIPEPPFAEPPGNPAPTLIGLFGTTISWYGVNEISRNCNSKKENLKNHRMTTSTTTTTENKTIRYVITHRKCSKT